MGKRVGVGQAGFWPEHLGGRMGHFLSEGAWERGRCCRNRCRRDVSRKARRQLDREGCPEECSAEMVLALDGLRLGRRE